MLTKKQSYQPQQLLDYQEKLRNQKIKQVQNTIKKLEIKEEEVSFSHT